MGKPNKCGYISYMINVGTHLSDCWTGCTDFTFILLKTSFFISKLIPTTISLVVSYTSAITVVGLGSEVYYGGTVGWPGFVLTFILSLTIMERFFVPWLYTLKLTSVFKV